MVKIKKHSQDPKLRCGNQGRGFRLSSFSIDRLGMQIKLCEFFIVSWVYLSETMDFFVSFSFFKLSCFIWWFIGPSPTVHTCHPNPLKFLVDCDTIEIPLGSYFCIVACVVQPSPDPVTSAPRDWRLVEPPSDSLRPSAIEFRNHFTPKTFKNSKVCIFDVLIWLLG